MLNLTPHPITIRNANGEDIVIPPSGTVARVSTTEKVVAPFGLPHDNLVGVPIVKREFGEVVGLPPLGELCIVSAMVLSAVPGRAGVYAPDTGSTAIRNENGHIVAVTRLVAA